MKVAAEAKAHSRPVIERNDRRLISQPYASPAQHKCPVGGALPLWRLPSAQTRLSELKHLMTKDRKCLFSIAYCPA